MTSKLTQARAREVLDYSAETGVFRWKVSTSNRAPVGSIAGTAQPKGYWQLTVDGQRFLAHRLAWFYVNGEWPEIIDHINGDKRDNRIHNLRPATNAENIAATRKISPRNTSGFRGVHWFKPHQKWAAVLAKKHLGYFDDPRAAYAAYVAAHRARYGEFSQVASA